MRTIILLSSLLVGCGPAIFVRNLSSSGKPIIYGLSCNDFAVCQRVASGLCPSGYVIVSHDEYGPYAEDIQIECKEK
jgi:hypothetical protein